MSKGRTWTALAVVTIAVAVGATLVWRTQARAETSKAAELKAACEKTGAWHKRAAALRDLSELGTDAAREALAALADSKDDSLAAQAVARLGRVDSTAAKSKLESVALDGDRSDFVRSMAVTAWMRSAKRDDLSKTAAAAKFDEAGRGNAALADAAKSAETKLWGGK